MENGIKIDNADEWTVYLPLVVKHLLSDWGYFEKDINLTDALNATEYLLWRLLGNTHDDFYSELRITDNLLHTQYKIDCLNFMHKYKQYYYSMKEGLL